MDERELSHQAVALILIKHLKAWLESNVLQIQYHFHDQIRPCLQEGITSNVLTLRNDSCNN